MIRTLKAKQPKTRAQSMVEFAVTLPILLLLLGGLMEVANLISIYSQLLTATREGARIAAAGGTDSVVVSTMGTSATGGIDPVAGRMEIWVVRPTVQTTPSWAWKGGPGWGSATEECIFPVNNAGNGTCANTTSGITPDGVMTDLRKITGAQTGNINNQQLVVVSVYYEAKTLLGLPFFKVASGQDGRVPLRAYTVMRLEVIEQAVNQVSGGCSAYPIALRTSITTAGGKTPLNASEGEEFTNIANGNPGFLYLLWRDGGSGLGVTLPRPGNESLTEYINPAVPTDTQLQRGDWVMVQTNTAGATNTDALPDHKAKNRTLRVILYDQDASLVGGKFRIQITGFAVVRIATHNSGGTVISFKFVRNDTSCGFN